KFQSVDQVTDGVTRPPRREDLYRTLQQGVEGTAMQSYNMLPDHQLHALISYVMHLSIRGEVEMEVFKNASVDSTTKKLKTSSLKGGSITAFVRGKRQTGGTVREVAEKWRESHDDDKKIQPGPYPIADGNTQAMQKSIQNGYGLFMGRGPYSAGCTQCHYDFGRKSLFKFDAWGTMVRPRDLTKPVYRGGRRPVDIYYRIHSGINGSGM